MDSLIEHVVQNSGLKRLDEIHDAITEAIKRLHVRNGEAIVVCMTLIVESMLKFDPPTQADPKNLAILFEVAAALQHITQEHWHQKRHAANRQTVDDLLKSLKNRKAPDVPPEPRSP